MAPTIGGSRDGNLKNISFGIFFKHCSSKLLVHFFASLHYSLMAKTVASAKERSIPTNINNSPCNQFIQNLFNLSPLLSDHGCKCFLLPAVPGSLVVSNHLGAPKFTPSKPLNYSKHVDPQRSKILPSRRRLGVRLCAQKRLGGCL